MGKRQKKNTTQRKKQYKIPFLSLTKAIYFLIFSLMFLFFTAEAVFAEVIHNFDTEILAHKDGVMTITEKINYDFEDDDRHGIFREIPTVSKVGELYRVIKIDVLGVKRDGKDEPYEVDSEPKQVSLKIGDADKTVRGAHTYEIKYKVENGIGSNFEDHDEIFWDATNKEAKVVVEKASAVVKTDFGVEVNRVTCFTRDANFNAQFCTFPNNPPYMPITTTAPLNPGDGLTVVAGFPVNTFPKSVIQNDEPLLIPTL